MRSWYELFELLGQPLTSNSGSFKLFESLTQLLEHTGQDRDLVTVKMAHRV